jgi:hypothetical protein
MRSFRNFFGQSVKGPEPAVDGPSLHNLLNGYRSTALLYVAAKLKIADLLADGPRGSDQLSELLQANPSSLHRVLRGLVVLGLCSETDDGFFQLTELGMKLKSDTNGPEYSLAILNGEEYAATWNNLLHSVMAGGTAFEHVFGESPWQHRQNNPELNERFNRWLEDGAASTGRAILSVYDFAAHQIVADIGGGQGALLTVILQNHLSLQGMLIDQPHVISAARSRLESAGVGNRCRLVAGNFFDAIPSGADVYILKSVLHDWNDEQCLLILRNCQVALKSGQSLLVVERILPDRALDQPSTIMSDLQMLAVTGGRERTVDEFKKLFAGSGFELKRTTPLATGHHLLEASRI